MATAECREPSLVIEVKRDVLQGLLESEPSLRENLVRQFRRLKERASRLLD
jgi:CRP-like cAMP-binding protein